MTAGKSIPISQDKATETQILYLIRAELLITPRPQETNDCKGRILTARFCDVLSVCTAYLLPVFATFSNMPAGPLMSMSTSPS